MNDLAQTWIPLKCLSVPIPFHSLWNKLTAGDIVMRVVGQEEASDRGSNPKSHNKQH